tara:strand:+ start:262 stop:510 length:249 start_codon:yes stop_codon:yes gene_type:complete
VERFTKHRENIFRCGSETLSLVRLVFQQFPNAFFVHASVFLAVRRHHFFLGGFDRFHVFKRVSVPLVREQLLLLSSKLQHRR